MCMYVYAYVCMCMYVYACVCMSEWIWIFFMGGFSIATFNLNHLEEGN